MRLLQRFLDEPFAAAIARLGRSRSGGGREAGKFFGSQFDEPVVFDRPGADDERGARDILRPR